MKKTMKIVNRPEFDEYHGKYINWQNLILGGENVENSQGQFKNKYGSNNTYNQYLVQAAHEPDAQWNIRNWLSCYRNYALPIVSVFSSAVWRKDPIRSLPSILEPYIKNVDRKGTTANVFFQTMTWWAGVHGVNHVLVDMPELPEGVPRTVEMDKQYNIRPYFVDISALNVPTWALSKGADVLDYIVIDERSLESMGPFDKAEMVQRYKFFNKELWETYTDIKGTLVKDNGDSHNLGRVPISTCYFRHDQPMVGESVISPIASLCIHAYRMNNSLDISLYNTAFPLMTLLGFDEDQVGEFVRSSHNGLMGPADASASYVEPSGRSFQDLRSAISQDVSDIQEIALRMIKPNGKQIQSAQSKREDRLQLDSQLSVFARNVENAEVKCWEIMLDWLKKPELKSEIKVEYNRDFNLNQISGEVLEAFSKMRESGDISRETFLRVLQQGEIPFPGDFNYKEEVVRINKERSSEPQDNEVKSNETDDTEIT